jgi:hypothetical protein
MARTYKRDNRGRFASGGTSSSGGKAKTAKPPTRGRNRLTRDNAGRITSVGGQGATARGGRLKTAAGNKRGAVVAKIKGSGGRLRGGKPGSGADDQKQYGQFIQAAKVPTRDEDWGAKARGQGKRLGGGMVRGAMSSAPSGIKRYPDFQRAKGMTPAVWKEIKLMTDEGKRAVIGALQAGWSTSRALRMAYLMEP